jgi:hypothetical protein
VHSTFRIDHCSYGNNSATQQIQQCISLRAYGTLHCNHRDSVTFSEWNSHILTKLVAYSSCRMTIVILFKVNKDGHKERLPRLSHSQGKDISLASFSENIQTLLYGLFIVMPPINRLKLKKLVLNNI